MRIPLSSEYLNARFKYCNKKLAGLPLITRGVHRGCKVIRIRQHIDGGKCKVKELRYTSKNLSKLNDIELLRKQLTEEIAMLMNTEGVDPQASVKIKASRGGSYNGDFYRSLTGELNTQKNTTDYFHKGIHMRSRAEMMVAEVLGELNLKYKYEPAVDVNGVIYYPDFVVYIEAIDCCFFVEVMGMTDDYKYMVNSIAKLNDYANAGIHINKNLLLITSTATYVPDFDDIYNSIVNLVNLTAWRVLV